jgi:hypothetical protein
MIARGVIVASLVEELKATDHVLRTMHRFMSHAQRLHAQFALQHSGDVDLDVLRERERTTVLALAASYKLQVQSILAIAGDLMHRFRTVAGQSTIKPPALDLEAADHIEKLQELICQLTGGCAARSI